MSSPWFHVCVVCLANISAKFCSLMIIVPIVQETPLLILLWTKLSDKTCVSHPSQWESAELLPMVFARRREITFYHLMAIFSTFCRRYGSYLTLLPRVTMLLYEVAFLGQYLAELPFLEDYC